MYRATLGTASCLSCNTTGGRVLTVMEVALYHYALAFCGPCATRGETVVGIRLLRFLLFRHQSDHSLLPPCRLLACCQRNRPWHSRPPRPLSSPTHTTPCRHPLAAPSPAVIQCIAARSVSTCRFHISSVTTRLCDHRDASYISGSADHLCTGHTK